MENYTDGIISETGQQGLAVALTSMADNEIKNRKMFPRKGINLAKSFPSAGPLVYGGFLANGAYEGIGKSNELWDNPTFRQKVAGFIAGGANDGSLGFIPYEETARGLAGEHAPMEQYIPPTREEILSRGKRRTHSNRRPK